MFNLKPKLFSYQFKPHISLLNLNGIRGNYTIFLLNNFCAAVKCALTRINCIKIQHTVFSAESKASFISGNTV